MATSPFVGWLLGEYGDFDPGGLGVLESLDPIRTIPVVREDSAVCQAVNGGLQAGDDVVGVAETGRFVVNPNDNRCRKPARGDHAIQ